MKECKKIRKDLVAFLYGELEAGRQESFLSHLKSCSDCQSELEKLEEVKRGADSLNKEIEEEMSSVDWETLPAQIADAVFKKEERQRESWFKRFSRALYQPQLRPVYAALLIGILLGSFFTFVVFRSPFKKQEKGEVLIIPQDFIERVELEMARRETLNYLEKSQYLILDFVQAASGEERTQWQREFSSQKAKNLLSKKKYINQQLDRFQMAKAKEICDQIEYLFYELTQVADHLPAWRIEEINNFIHEKQLLLKIKLLKKELEESKKSEV